MANNEFPHSTNPSPDTQMLLELKDRLLAGWRLLPVEHQASLVCGAKETCVVKMGVAETTSYRTG